MYGYCNECKRELTSPTDYKFYRGAKVCLECNDKKTSLNKKGSDKRKKLENYIKELFDFSDIPIGYSQQIDKFIKEYKFTTTGIEASLYYFYEVLENSVENDVFLGIVPRVYDEAKRYFQQIKKIEKINQEFEAKEEKEIVRIRKPDGKIPLKSSTEGWE